MKDITNPEEFSKDLFLAIKGVAIIMMVYHHCFGFPSWYIDSVAQATHYSELEIYIARVSKLCVSIFAFLTGWSYYIKRDNAIRYSINKTTAFLFRLAIVVLVLLYAAYAIAGIPITTKSFVYELFPIRYHLFGFSWYVVFYIASMLILPYIVRLEHMENKFWLVFYLAIAALCARYLLSNTSISYIVTYMPCVIIGYLCARFRVFELIITKLQTIRGATILGTLLLLLPYIIYNKIDILHKIGLFRSLSAFSICSGIIMLFPMLSKLKISSIIKNLGKHSLNIWLLHNLYFSSHTKSFFQPIAYNNQSPICVLLVVILSCYIVSFLLTPLQNYVATFFVNKLRDI